MNNIVSLPVVFSYSLLLQFIVLFNQAHTRRDTSEETVMSEKISPPPFYGLYGDRTTQSSPGFVHIEDIATRSKGLDWHIKPHRHNRLFQILCIFDGEMEIQLNRETHPLQGNWVVTIPVGVVHGFRFQPNSDGFVLSVTDSVLAEEILQGFGGHSSEFFQIPQLINPNKGDRQFQQFLRYIDLIREEFSSHGADQDQSLGLLSRLALMTLNRQLQHKKLQASLGQKESLMLSKFRALIEDHYRDHWTVSTYADALHVSTSTLNRLCQQSLGDSPKRLIQDRLLTDAKRRLIYTQQSLEEIAYTLGFKDYPYFSRFFKKLEGMTAGSYRKQSER